MTSSVETETCRPWTDDRYDPVTGITTIRVKRACNGCGTKLGDVTGEELDAAVLGRELPDVREECGCLASDDGPVEVMHCWDPSVTIGFAFHAPHIWQAGVGPRQCPGHVRINGRVHRLDELPMDDQRIAAPLALVINDDEDDEPAEDDPDWARDVRMDR